MRWRALWLIVGVTMLLLRTGAAEAKNFNHLLRGDYAFSGEAACLVSPGGFNLNLTPVGPPAPFPFVISFSVRGVRTFNGDGTGHLNARAVSIFHPFALPAQTQQQPPFANLGTPFFNRGSASSADFEANFTYEVAPDLAFTVESPTITGTALTGPGAGQTITITNFPPFSGRISQDHRTLTLAYEEPSVETVTFFNGNVQVGTQQRICHRSRILLELKP